MAQLEIVLGGLTISLGLELD